MDRGLYIAASGMLTEQLRQQQISNDLANSSTPGYKADRTAQRSFGSLALVNKLTGASIGSESLGVEVDKVVTDFTPQPSRDTGEPLDFAITGNGFFAVQTAKGTRYTGSSTPRRPASSSRRPATRSSAAPASRSRSARTAPWTRASSTWSCSTTRPRPATTS
jgi:flagellar basal-body rod protein FlgG